MNITIGKKIGTGFGVLLGFVAMLSVVVLIHLDEIHRQFSFVIQHDAPVIANARQLQKLVVDMETGQRGFVITGKQEFLEPYENAHSEFEELVNEEKELVSNTPPQVKRLEKIEASLQEWKTKAAQPEIAMRRKISEATVDAHRLQEILSHGVGKHLMDRFMVLGHEVELSFSERGHWEGAFYAEAIEKCMTDREAGQRGFLITGKEEFLEKYNAGEQRKLSVYFARLREIATEKNLEKEVTEKIDKMQQLAVEWARKAAIPEIAARRSMNEHPETLQTVANMLEIGTGKRILDGIRADFEKFIQEAEIMTDERFSTATTTAVTTKFTIIVLALASLILGGGMALKITFGITKPIYHLANALRKVTIGDLSQEIQIQSDDEIGELSNSFNQMVIDQRQVVTQIKTISTGDFSEEIAPRSDQDELGNALLEMTKRLRDSVAQLCESTAQQKAIMAASLDPMVTIDFKGTVMSVSNSVERVFGYIAEEVIGQNIQILMPDPYRSQHDGYLKKYRQTGLSNLLGKTRELVAKRKNGEVFPCEISVSRVDLPNQKEPIFTGTIRDISDRKVVENRLRKQAKSLEINTKICQAVAKGDYSQIEIEEGELDQLGTAISQMVINLRQMEIDRDGTEQQLMKINEDLAREATFKDARATLAGIMQDAGDLPKLGDTVIEFVANHTESQMGAFYACPLEEGEGEGEGEGSLHLVGTYASPGRERSVRNIATGENLVSQAARSRKSIVVSDVPKDYIKVTSGLGEALPRHLLVLPMLDGARLKGVIELAAFGAFSDAQIAEIETLLQPVAGAIEAKQGAEKIQSLLKASQQQATELAIANDELELTSRDLERQKAAIQDRNSALEVVRRDVEEKAKELARSSQFKSDFLANMSHEIRTPLTAILGFAGIVRDNVSDSESQDWLDKIQRNGDHLLGIINDILDISKIESNMMTIETMEVSPSQALSDVVSLMSTRASEKDIALQVEYNGPIPHSIKTDPTRLRQILINLTGNGIKFTNAGEVRLVVRVVGAKTDQPQIVFEVIDTGIGLTEAQIGELFQPFVQADTSTTRKFGGTGLGLTISKRLTEMLGGDLTVHSVYGEGSTFTVTLPTGLLNHVKMIGGPSETAPTVDVGLEKEEKDIQLDCRILLAEDGHYNQQLISFLLKKAGADLTIAENGEIAVELALQARDSREPFDVILMDMQMPVVDGYTATAQLRESGYCGPIIALTANAMSSDRVKCIDAGCDDYMSKPIDRKKLISLVNQYALGQKPSEVLNIGG